jgi:hypothetical protein
MANNTNQTESGKHCAKWQKEKATEETGWSAHKRPRRGAEEVWVEKSEAKRRRRRGREEVMKRMRSGTEEAPWVYHALLWVG